jgi:hypothetical protein
MVDPRKIVGNHIRAKAKHVTSDAECKHRYGSNLNTKMLYGVVVGVENIINTTTKSSKTMITGTYNLSGGIEKTKKLHLINIQAVLPGDVDDLLIETTPLETGPRYYLQQQFDRQINITIQETTIYNNRVTKNDNTNNDMITEDTIRDIASRAIAQTLESHLDRCIFCK